jgi:hypothetical protein
MTENQVTDPAPPGEGTSIAGRHRFGAGASGLLSLLLVGALFAVPLFGIFVAPLGLIPVLQYQAAARRWYLAWSWVAVLLAVATVSGLGALTAPILAAYLLLVVFPSIAIQWWRLLKWSEGRWAATAALVTTVCSLVVVASVFAPEAPVQGVATWFRDAAIQAGDFYSSMGFAKGEVDLALDAVERYASWVVPSIPVMYLVAVLFWIRPRLPMFGMDLPIGLFEEYRSDEWLPAGFALFGLGTLMLEGTPRWVALNLLLTVLILYFIHGLAIIRAHLARWIGRGWLVRWGVILISLQMPLPLLVAALGLADSFHPMRPQANDDGGRQ